VEPADRAHLQLDPGLQPRTRRLDYVNGAKLQILIAAKSGSVVLPT
jgi:hypothetical protein